MPTIILRPTADGALLECRVYPATPPTHYDKVDEETPNDDTDGVESQPAEGSYRDCFIKQPSNIPSGSTINSVTIYIRAKSSYYAGVYYGNFATLLRNAAGTIVIGPIRRSAGVWTTVYDTYTTSPFTGLPWTVSEVEGLQIGVRLSTGVDEYGTPYPSRCSTVWLVVDYTPPPAIRPFYLKTRKSVVYIG